MANAMTLRHDDSSDRELSQIAARLGTSKNDAVLHAIHSTFDREQFEAQVERSAERGIAKFGALLDRLGS